MTSFSRKPGTVKMAPEEFRLLQEFVAERFGLTIETFKQESLAARLLPRLEALRLRSFSEYYTYLKYAPDSGEDLLRLITLLTNNETYFYREEPQLSLFSSATLPALKQVKLQCSEKTIRILSAGCSTGEEPYTLAMLLMEAGLFLWDWQVTITGVDLDAAALGVARRGEYGPKSFHSLPEPLRERYFSREDAVWRVQAGLRRLTEFRHGNLLEIDDVMKGEQLDVIFCRNVLIYFSQDTVRKVVERFSRILRPGGWLFLGHSESLLRISDRFEPVRVGGGIAYRLRCP